MGDLVSGLFGGGSSQQAPPPPPLPIEAPPAYQSPSANKAAAPRPVAGGFSSNIITGPQGLTAPVSTTQKKLTGE